VKDVNELRKRLVEVAVGLQQNVIDDAIDHAVVPAFGLEEDILSLCCDRISYLGYGS